MVLGKLQKGARLIDENELLRRKFELELSLAQMPMEHHEKLRIIKKVLDQCEEVLEEGFDDFD